LLISYNFLKKYVNIDIPASELANKMNMHGLAVDEIIEKKCEITNVFVAKILKIEKHPNADKLSLCTVTDGNETMSVVCGAKNIKENQIVPLAKDGATLPNNVTIKKTSIRGIESNGMLCSAKELGINDDHSGILILDPEKYKIGQKFLPFESDTIFNVDITPNRPDLLCITGVARLISGILDEKFTPPVPVIKKEFIDKTLDINKKLKVKLLDTKRCLRYSARLIQGVKIDESPQWLKNILLSSGIRPINNVVDITNYVMLEMNQPLHAFDYDKLTENTIIVRTAKSGESILALNGKNYNLNEDNLIIADAGKPVAIAGIMGGELFSVNNSTNSIVLESAYFLPGSIRKTSKTLGISSDSSYRFERGIDINNLVNALNRATELILEICGGKTSKNIIDAYPVKIKPIKIKLNFNRVNKILGTNFKNTEIIKFIKKLYFNISSVTKTYCTVIVPSYRVDIKEDIDIIEDIAQIYGYNKIPLTLPESNLTIGREIKLETFNKNISNILTSFGFYEVKNYSFLNNNFLKILKLKNYDTKEAVKLKNPFNEEETHLKTTLFPDLIKNFIFNYNNGNFNVHLFEIANVYKNENGNYKQIPFIGAISGGFIINTSFNKKEFISDFYYIKSIINEINKYLNINTEFDYSDATFDNEFLEYCCKISLNNELIGVAGKLRNEILYDNKIKENVFLFELNIEKLFALFNKEIKYRKFSQFPAVNRDISLVVNRSIPEKNVEEIIKKTAKDFIKSIKLYDIYYGEQIPKDCKSLTYNILFQSIERTLSEKEVNDIVQNIITNLKNEINANLRS